MIFIAEILKAIQCKFLGSWFEVHVPFWSFSSILVSNPSLYLIMLRCRQMLHTSCTLSLKINLWKAPWHARICFTKLQKENLWIIHNTSCHQVSQGQLLQIKTVHREVRRWNDVTGARASLWCARENLRGNILMLHNLSSQCQEDSGLRVSLPKQ